MLQLLPPGSVCCGGEIRLDWQVETTNRRRAEEAAVRRSSNERARITGFFFFLLGDSVPQELSGA